MRRVSAKPHAKIPAAAQPPGGVVPQRGHVPVHSVIPPLSTRCTSSAWAKGPGAEGERFTALEPDRRGRALGTRCFPCAGDPSEAAPGGPGSRGSAGHSPAGTTDRRGTNAAPWHSCPWSTCGRRWLLPSSQRKNHAWKMRPPMPDHTIRGGARWWTATCSHRDTSAIWRPNAPPTCRALHLWIPGNVLRRSWRLVLSTGIASPPRGKQTGYFGPTLSRKYPDGSNWAPSSVPLSL